MSQIQSPPANAGGKTNPVDCSSLTSPVGLAVFVIDVEFPESFGVTQESVVWTLTAA